MLAGERQALGGAYRDLARERDTAQLEARLAQVIETLRRARQPCACSATTSPPSRARSASPRSSPDNLTQGASLPAPRRAALGVCPCHNRQGGPL